MATSPQVDSDRWTAANQALHALYIAVEPEVAQHVIALVEAARVGDRLTLAHRTAQRDSYKHAFEQLRDHGILAVAD
jgi:hypothetical protein